MTSFGSWTRARMPAAALAVGLAVGPALMAFGQGAPVIRDDPGAPAGRNRPEARPGGSVLADLSVRMTQLENEIRRLTGQNEEYGHAIREMKARLDKLTADVDQRLGALEGHSANGAGAADRAAASGGQGTGAAPTPLTGADDRQQAGSSPAPGPQVLGRLRVNPATGKPVGAGAAPQNGAQESPPTQQAAVPREETPGQMYKRATDLLLKDQNVGEAEKLLSEFLQKYPKNKLAAHAYYWLGRAYFVSKDYQQAAFTFADAFQKFPKSDKAPSNLLNLGMSLARLGKTKEACTAYQRLQQNYPDTEDSFKRQIATERRRAKCG